MENGNLFNEDGVKSVRWCYLCAENRMNCEWNWLRIVALQGRNGRWLKITALYSVSLQKVWIPFSRRGGKLAEVSERLYLYIYLAMPIVSKDFQRLPSGAGAIKSISSFDTGWMKRILRACRQMLPSGLERGKPYFRSPLMGHPIFANWQRIWWWRPVFRLTSNK